MALLKILDDNGDTTLEWDRADEMSVAEVRQRFDALMSAGGMMAFKIDPKDRTQGEQIRAFDPDAEELVISRALQGG